MTRRLLAALLAIVLVLSGCTRGSRGESGMGPGDGIDLAPAYREPVKLTSTQGILEVRLTARQSEATLNTVARPVTGMMLYDWKLIHGTSSNGETSGRHAYPAPTLAVKPGEKLVIHMINGLHDLTIPDFTDPVLTPAGTAVPLVPEAATSVPINLHTHGLHVSPNLNSDNVLLEIPAGMGNTYEYDIPANHPQGLYWYHPHRHQLTESHVYRGLAGLLEVGRPEGDIPKVAAGKLPVRTMALQLNFVPNRAGGQHYLGYPSLPQMVNTKAEPAPAALTNGTYRPLLTPVNFADSTPGTTFKTNWFAGPLTAENKRGSFQFIPQNLIDFSGDDPAVASPADRSYPDALRDVQFTVNGQFQPVIEAAPGQTEVWNLANIGSQAYMNIAVRNTATKELVPLRVLGRDGNPDPAVGTGMARNGSTYLLAPASRVTLAVTMPHTGGLELVMPPLAGPDTGHTQPLSTRGILYTNSDGKISGQLGTVSIDMANLNWLDGFKSVPVQTLASVTPKGNPVAAVPFTPGERLTDDSPFVDTAAMTVAQRRVFAIGGGASPWVNPDDPNGFMYMFNKTTWPTTPVIHPRLNTVEEWRFVNTNNDQHPIHVHVNDFQVMGAIDPVTGVNSGVQPHAYDTFNVPAPLLDAAGEGTTPGEITIRSLFQDFTGTFVTHCHRLDHEDNGLMMTINVIPEVSTYAIATQQGQAPAVVEVRDQADDAVLARVTPFPGSRTLPTVTMADVDGDQVLDLLVGSGPGDRGAVVAFSGAKGSFTRELLRFNVFDDNFRGGVNVAAGIIAGSPLASNIVVSSGPGRPNEVVVYSNELPAEPGSAPPVFSSFEPHPGQDGTVLAVGLTDPMGRVSIVTAPTTGSTVRVFNYSLLTNEPGGHRHGDDPHAGDGPHLVTEFRAFDDYDGPMSLATGWIAGNEGGAESIIAGQRTGQGLVRSFSSGSQLTGQSPMYVEQFDHQMKVQFTPTMTFQPFGSGVTVATTSTTSGAKLLAFGTQDATLTMRSFDVERSLRVPASLHPIATGAVVFPDVDRGAVGG